MPQCPMPNAPLPTITLLMKLLTTPSMRCYATDVYFFIILSPVHFFALHPITFHGILLGKRNQLELIRNVIQTLTISLYLYICAPYVRLIWQRQCSARMIRLHMNNFLIDEVKKELHNK